MTKKTGTAQGYIEFLDQLQALLCAAGHAHGRAYTGTGDGTLTGVGGEPGGYVGGSASVAETFTLTATSATEFAVVGSTAGAIGTATVGVAFVHPRLSFRINAGATPFEVGDQFRLSTSPPWDMVRRQGVRTVEQRTTNMTDGARLWDQVTSGATAAATRAAGALPAFGAIAMIGAAEVGQIAIGAHQTPGRAPAAFALDWSDNGTDWTQTQAWAGVTFGASERRTFAVTSAPGPHAFWRVRFTALVTPAETQLEVTELDFLAAGAPDIILNRRAEFILKAPGNDGVSEIYIGGELYEDTSTGAASFNFYGMRAYDPTKPVRAQPNASALTNVPLSSSAFDWAAYVNGRRIVAVARIGTVYVPFYQGLGKPYELPSVHPYPAVNAGCGSSETRLVSSTSADFRGFSSPGRYGLWARYPDNVWRAHANRFQQSFDQPDTATAGKVYPASLGTGGIEPALRENLDGSRPLFELVLFNSTPRHVWGELDGCYFVPGLNVSPEQVVNMDGFGHVVYPNTFRVGYADFYAIRED